MGCPGKHRKDWAYLRFPPTFLLGQSEYPGGHLMVRNVCVAGTLWQGNRTESSGRQENGAGQDFQLMEQCMEQRQYKVTAAAFSPALSHL